MKVVAGSKLLSAQPFAWVVSNSHSELFCHHCFVRLDKPLRCSLCKFAHYCGKSCQRKSWSLHKVECRCLQKIPAVPTETPRLMARLIFAEKAGRDAPKEVYMDGIPHVERTMGNLESHLPEIRRDSMRWSKYFDLCAILSRYIGGEATLEPNNILEIFGKVMINSFSICDGEMNPIGTGLYFGPSVLDHSCEPTATVSFDGRALNVMATETLDIDSLTDVRISYTNLLATTDERQTELQQLYYFQCECAKCTDDKLDRHMFGLKCSDESCDGVMLPDDVVGDGSKPTCEKCGMTDISVDVNNVYQDGTVLLDRLMKAKERLDTDNPEMVSEVFDEGERALCEVAHLAECHIVTVRLRDVMMDLAVDARRMAAALHHGLHTLDGYRLYLPRHHPTTAVQLSKVAALLHFNEKLSQANDLYVEALEIFQVTHGAAHSHLNMVRQRLDNLRREMVTSGGS